ncbi:hypothetical protein CLOHYLEM_05980 [[Clostridium] hylemonae DSM 15053]|uniref:Uncharacterized protein n=1 Tax=[Clostridium] hylemonae DSM 15053 TaxID=553973 RepID=C0C1G1_9FIRM|nr:hypothetical protein CLOHYLEM_05980 [[Clostridium] hylemonae DSM 15053]
MNCVEERHGKVLVDNILVDFSMESYYNFNYREFQLREVVNRW